MLRPFTLLPTKPLDSVHSCTKKNWFLDRPPPYYFPTTPRHIDTVLIVDFNDTLKSVNGFDGNRGLIFFGVLVYATGRRYFSPGEHTTMSLNVIRSICTIFILILLLHGTGGYVL